MATVPVLVAEGSCSIRLLISWACRTAVESTVVSITLRINGENNPGGTGSISPAKRAVADPLLAGMAFTRVPASADKTMRALPAVARCEQSGLATAHAGWHQEYLDDLSAFPEPGHDDQMDTVAEAFCKIRTTHMNALRESVQQRETSSMITLGIIDFTDDFEVATLPGIEPGLPP